MTARTRIPSTVSPGRFMLIGPAHDQLTDADRPGEVSVQITDRVNSVTCYVPVGALREALGTDPRVAELEAEVARLKADKRKAIGIGADCLMDLDRAQADLAAARAALAAVQEVSAVSLVMVSKGSPEFRDGFAAGVAALVQAQDDAYRSALATTPSETEAGRP